MLLKRRDILVRTMFSLLFVACLVAISSAACRAADWPMYRGDAARTARTQATLPILAGQQWAYQADHAPRPAWPRSRRMGFDRVMHLVVHDHILLFGSSVDGLVRALDINSGAPIWEFFTDGPIRFAPAVWHDRAFVASDDGYLYSLRLADGKLLWKKHGAPGSDLVLGNGAMISKWPARGGPVVARDTVYFATGIWPSDGIYLYALDAQTGREIWCNSDSGSLFMPQPHPTAEAKSGVSAQGYLVISGNHLLVPTGRAVPASFDQKTGRFEYFHLQKYGHNGATQTMAIGDVFFNGGLSFGTGDGQLVAKLGTGAIAALPDGVVRAVGGSLTAYKWVQQKGFDRKGRRVTRRVLAPQWTAKHVPDAVAILVAGDRIVLGGNRRVAIFDTATRNVVWQTVVEGKAYGLAVANNRLFVSTDLGTIYCFSAKQRSAAPANHASHAPVLAGPAPTNELAARAARQIVRETGVTNGYCLDLSCGDGSLAVELARRTQLQVIAIDADPHNVTKARQRLRAAKLYGSRVQVLQCKATDERLPPYFADLIVSGSSTHAKLTPANIDAGKRLLRPYGGMMCVGPPDAMNVSVRGSVQGAGRWTHQYADPANTANSLDQLVRGHLTMLWFRDVDFQLAQRHGRPPAPLFSDGRLFHEGLDGLIAVNAYNGAELWRFHVPNVLRAYNGDELMGVAGTGSNYCLGKGSVYLRSADRCFRLDAATGTVVRTYRTPAVDATTTKHPTWGYIAFADNILFGSEANPKHIVTYRFVNRGGDMTKLLTESNALFARDPNDGKLLWRHPARNSIRNNAIAIASGKVVLIDRPMALFDRVKRHPPEKQPTGTLIALDERTGKVLWQNAADIYGTMLAISAKHGVVLMSYQPTRFRLDSEIGGRMAAFRLDDGTRLWDIKAKYASRPMINERTIFAQGGAWDLLTGKPVPFKFKRSYGCGILASSKHMLLFRSATLGYYDLDGARTTVNYGGIRPGCWINTLPVGGIVLLPDATAGCECSYLNRAWVALRPEF